MTLLPVSGYTTDELAGALHSLKRQVKFGYDILDSKNEYLRSAKMVVGGEISNNALATIKRTAKFQFGDDDEVDWLSERIRPTYNLLMPNGGWATWPLGVFLPSTPARQITNTGSARQVEAYDQLLVISEDKVDTRYVVSAGASYTESARLLLANILGITQFSIPEHGATLLVAREWDPGTSKLRIINDLLGAVNYESLSFNADGVAYSRAYVPPNERPISYTYRTDDESVLVPDAEVEMDLFSVPNVFVGIVAEPDRLPLRSVYTNDNPASPTSTVRRGRSIVEVYTDMEAADQTTLDGLLNRKAFNASQVFETTTFRTLGMPFHGNLDVIKLDYSRLGEVDYYAESGWTLPLKAGSVMKHVVRKVVPV